jgi:hypothetical protein
MLRDAAALLLEAPGVRSTPTNASTDGRSSSGHTPGVINTCGVLPAAPDAVLLVLLLVRPVKACSCCSAPSLSRAFASMASAAAILRSSSSTTAVVCAPSPMFSRPAEHAKQLGSGEAIAMLLLHAID